MAARSRGRTGTRHGTGQGELLCAAGRNTSSTRKTGSSGKCSRRVYEGFPGAGDGYLQQQPERISSQPSPPQPSPPQPSPPQPSANQPGPSQPGPSQPGPSQPRHLRRSMGETENVAREDLLCWTPDTPVATPAAAGHCFIMSSDIPVADDVESCPSEDSGVNVSETASGRREDSVDGESVFSDIGLYDDDEAQDPDSDTDTLLDDDENPPQSPDEYMDTLLDHVSKSLATYSSQREEEMVGEAMTDTGSSHSMADSGNSFNSSDRDDESNDAADSPVEGLDSAADNDSMEDLCSKFHHVDSLVVINRGRERDEETDTLQLPHFESGFDIESFSSSESLSSDNSFPRRRRRFFRPKDRPESFFLQSSSSDTNLDNAAVSSTPPDTSSDQCSSSPQDASTPTEESHYSCTTAILVSPPDSAIGSECPQPSADSSDMLELPDTDNEESGVSLSLWDSLNDDREFNFTRPDVKRSSSLKSEKTPPGTPNKKKAVRFADALGLDLHHVRHFLESDNPPSVPDSAFGTLEIAAPSTPVVMGSRYLTPTFPQPSLDCAFVQRVHHQKVCLESITITSDNCILGFVRVKNIGYNKDVTVRFSSDNWKTSYDVPCQYVFDTCNDGTDRFSFNLTKGKDVQVGGQLQFCIRFRVNNEEFWDNNYSQNYACECYANASPNVSESTWVHFI